MEALTQQNHYPTFNPQDLKRLEARLKDPEKKEAGTGEIAWAFGRGLADGFIDGAKEMVSDVGSTVVSAGETLLEEGIKFYTNPKDYALKTAENVADLSTKVLDLGKSTYESIKKDPSQFLQDMADGVSDIGKQALDQAKEWGEKAIKDVSQKIEDFKNADSLEIAYKSGYVTGRVAAEVAPALLSGGAVNAVAKGSKLARLAGKFSKLAKVANKVKNIGQKAKPIFNKAKKVFQNGKKILQKAGHAANYLKDFSGSLKSGLKNKITGKLKSKIEGLLPKSVSAKASQAKAREKVKKAIELWDQAGQKIPKEYQARASLDMAVESFKNHTSDVKNYLGVYRTPNQMAFYNNNGIVYSDIEKKAGGIGEIAKVALSPRGLVPKLADGSLLVGSHKIEVWGDSNKKGASWRVYKYSPKYTDISGTFTKHEWVPMNYNQALTLDITQKALENFKNHPLSQ